jgi:hypothetical protein
MDIGLTAEDGFEDYVYDTYDQIIDDLDETSGAEMQPDYLDDYDPLNAAAMGMAFALADEIAEAEKGRYDLDAETDETNMRMASLMTRAASNHEPARLRPFEQYVQDFCRNADEFLRG